MTDAHLPLATNRWGDPVVPVRPISNARRAATALGFAVPLFAVSHVVCGRIAVALYGSTAGAEAEGFADLGLLVTLLFYGALAVVALVPAAVFSVGLFVDIKTRHLPRVRAAAVHAVVGLVLGIGVAGFFASAGIGTWLTALIAFAVPPAIASGVTHLIVPTALQTRWIAVIGWVMTALLFVGGAVAIVALFAR